MKKFSAAARHKARRYALQALYQQQMTGCGSFELEKQFFEQYDMEKVDRDYFKLLIHEIPKNTERLIKQFEQFIERELKDVNPIEHVILEIATFELTDCLDVPFRVIINEALELVKKFGSGDDGSKFINSVLDRVAKVIRKSEIG